MSVVVQPRVARRLIAAGAAAIALLGLLLVLLVATLMGGLAPPNPCGPGAGTRYAPSPVALADIPGNYLQWIRQAGDRYGLDWSVIAGIYSIETDFGRLDAPGVRSGENFAGAGGPGQFLAGTWRIYGVDGDGDGVKDRYNPADAIPGTANLLRRSGAPADYRRAVFAYNHASWYVDDVLARAARYRGAAEADPDAVQAALVADASATAACAELVGAGGPADLNRAVRLSFPAAYRALPAWAMAAGRPPQPVDARIYNDVRLAAAPLQRARHSCARGRPPHPWRRHCGGSRARGRARPSATGTGRSAGWRAISAGRRAAGTPAPGPRAHSSRRSSGSATTATRATGRRGPARAGARRTSTCRGCPRATARARSWRRARG